jgi:hypothetical protein
MNVYLTEIHSIQDAIRTMYMSKRSWTLELENEIREVVSHCTDRYGKPIDLPVDDPLKIKFDDMVRKLFKWGRMHITMLRFLDVSVVIEGLHRGGTDDLDAHAKRMENRIIRSSTRLANYSTAEVSEWYSDKIIPTDVALSVLGIKTPDEIEFEGKTYVRAENGYIVKGMENDKDVKRGLYMLSLPMTFTFKINITELAHVYIERGKSKKNGGLAHGTAAPELQIAMEDLIDQIEEWYPGITREFLLEVENNNV